MILLNKAHYWVLKQHTDSTPQLTLSRSLTVERSFMLFRYHRVSAATQSTIPAFCVSCKSVFRDSHHNVSFLNSPTITNRQPEILLSKKPKHYTIESQSNRFWLGETPKKTLRFFLLAAATHTTIQMPKWVCNPKMGELGHKHGLERVSNTLTNTKLPSQCVLWVVENL